ncbi:MAG: DUF1440 domain-containing protein [Acidobacteriota bacterium]|nr:DUF1440 domain-containing protein [Acidobacteriota bacterium]
MNSSRRGTRRDDSDVLKGIAAGLVGGLVASWTMNQFQALLSTLAEEDKKSQDDSKEGDDATVKAASAISEGVFNHELTKNEKRVAGPTVHYALGTTMGGLYGALAEIAPIASVGFGLAFGAIFWVAADEAAVPALGLSKSPTESPLSTHASALASHLVYGLTTDLVRRALRSAL